MLLEAVVDIPEAIEWQPAKTSCGKKMLLEGHGFSRAALTSTLEGFSP